MAKKVAKKERAGLKQATTEGIFKELAERFSGDPEFYALWAQMARLHDSKNQDYAGGHDPLFNLIATEVLKIGFPCPRCGGEVIVPGEVSIMIRKIDKVLRDINLTRTGRASVKTESSEDTNIDEAVYSLLEAAYRRRKRAQPPGKAGTAKHA